MAKNLLIVEAPAKAKTINKYLGKDFQVLASYGHVRDLVPKEGAVDIDNDFAMNYEVIEKNEKHVDAIAKAAAKADSLYLATDLDREGEAISWHIAEILKQRGLLEGRAVHRVVFSEITPRAIKEAVAQPRKLSMDLVNAPPRGSGSEKSMLRKRLVSSACRRADWPNVPWRMRSATRRSRSRSA